MIIEASIFLSLKYFFTVFGYEVAIFLFLKLLILIFSGQANDNLHLEKPKLKTFSIDVFLNKDFSSNIFSPTIARSASPLDTKEGMSSLLTNNISIGILLAFAKRLSVLIEKLIPDFLIKSAL